MSYAIGKCHGYTHAEDCTNCPLCDRPLLPKPADNEALSFDSYSAALYWVDAFYKPKQLSVSV